MPVRPNPRCLERKFAAEEDRVPAANLDRSEALGASEELCRKQHPECQGGPAEEIGPDQSRAGNFWRGIEPLAEDHAEETARNCADHGDVPYIIVIHPK